MNRKLFLIGKTLINSGLILMLPLPILSHEQAWGVTAVLYFLGMFMLGCIICVISKKTPTPETYNFRETLIAMYFKTIVWSLAIAIAFHVITACVIGYFYCLKYELGGTLLGTALIGIVLGFIFEIAVPLFKNNDKKR